eukprot:6447935-Pyramimonas_sp.AAC.1
MRFFPSLQNPRICPGEPATGPGELPASFHACLHACWHAWKRFCQRFGSAAGELPGALQKRAPVPKASLTSQSSLAKS